MNDTTAPSEAEGLESLPRTAQGWIPIMLFDKAFFHEGQGFLVQLSDDDGTMESPSHICEAQWLAQDIAGPLTFVGNWRYVDELRHLEPVAFQPLPRASSWSELLNSRAALDEAMVAA
jgi:hypothetical protein